MEISQLLPPQIADNEQPDPLLQAMLEFEEAARYLDLENWIVQRLRNAEREITTTIVLKRDGLAASFTGLRVQHHSGARPTIGPVHLREAGMHETKAAAMQQTWQLALVEAPFGGSAGALVCNPEQLAESDLHELASQYVRSLRGVVTSQNDILTPGERCNEQTMAWLLAHNTELWDMGAVVGKPAVLWGVPGFYDGAALGIAALLEEALGGLKDKCISIQGFGAVGAALACLLQPRGARIVALADSSGGLCKPDGLDISAVASHLSEKSVLFGFPGAENVYNADVLEADCEALVLTMGERQINAANADRVRARLLVEAHAGAVTGAAAVALSDRIIIPRLLAAAGAAVAAEVEWLHSTNPTLPITNLADIIAQRMRTTWHALQIFADQHDLGLREAALIMAVDRVASRMRLRGE